MTTSIQEQQKQSLLKRIDEATSISDIMPMIKYIDLGEIKRILKCKIDASGSEQSQMFYDSISIDQVLPMDVIQHITSFNYASETKLVSKAFNKCTKQNENQRTKKREQDIASIIGINEESKTWVITSKRTELTEQEKEQKYNGPINNFLSAMDMAKNGDTLLFDGYVWPKEDILIIHKSLRLIGYEGGGEVKLEANTFSINNNLFCQNISFYSDEQFNVESEYPCRFNQCDFIFSEFGISTGEGSDVDFRNCRFYNGEYEAISIEENPKNVSITNCYFQEIGIDSGNDYPVITVERLEDLKKIKCTQNEFCLCEGVPIGLEDKAQSMEKALAKASMFLKFNNNKVSGQSNDNKTFQTITDFLMQNAP